MVAGWLVVAAIAAQQGPTITLSVDRSDVLAGDAIVVTLVAHSAGDAPAEIVNPAFDGFEVTDQRDRSAVRIRGGAAERETIRMITVRALRAGSFVVGPAELHQGQATSRSGTVEVRVRARGEGAALAPRVRGFAERMTSPTIEGNQVAITTHAVPESAVVGAQVDLVVIAWFPRALRAQLRTPPALRAPQVSGAWVYHQHVPASPALARMVGGRPFDLYVLHDVLFPLRPGTVEIGAASVSFALPLSRTPLSREVRHEVTGRPVQLRVSPLAAGATELPVGANLRWTVELPAGELRLGDARVANVTVAGLGNVALWPEPEIAWPRGIRTYPEETRTEVTADGGRIGGRKLFRFLVVAESTGAHRIPAPRYPYYDVDAARVVTLEAPAAEVVTPGGRPGALRAVAPAPPLLTGASSVPLAERVVALLWPGGWLSIAVLLPLMAYWSRARPRRRRRPPPPEVPSTLGGLAREFRSVLEALVPDQALREGDRLADALRAAGVEEPVAQHAVRLRDRLRQAVFGPDGAPDTDELVAEVHEVLGVLVGEVARTRDPVAPVAAAVLALLVVGVTTAPAQSPSRLYETGAYRAAADSFHRETMTRPRDAGAWHNLGSALLQMDGRVVARAAWTRAARLDPRNTLIRGHLRSLGAPDRRSAAMLWVSPVTPAEALLVGVGLWVVTWILVGARVRGRVVAPIAMVSLGAIAYAAFVHERYAMTVALAGRAEVALLEAPYGSAPMTARLDEGMAVRIVRTRGSWVLATHGAQGGWVRASDLVAV
jgi:hypothetical protein